MVSNKISVRLLTAIVCAMAAILFAIAGFQHATKARFTSHLAQPSGEDNDVPALFIFRRTRKTGSSSMVEALLSSVASSYGYVPLPFRYRDINRALSLEYIRRDGQTNGPRIMVVNHNDITRNFHPRRDVVIADTIRDGFEQITSYCRHIRRVPDCGKYIEACMRLPSTQDQAIYRWAGRSKEDEDTYIDLPLSSAHPMLSTAVLRTVYPNISPLQIDYYNVRNSACENTTHLRDVYNVYFKHLDEQVDDLKRRLLLIAGYPTTLAASVPRRLRKAISLNNLLDAAEIQERKRNHFPPQLSSPPTNFLQSEKALQLSADQQTWALARNGTLHVSTRGEAERINTKIKRLHNHIATSQH